MVGQKGSGSTIPNMVGNNKTVTTNKAYMHLSVEMYPAGTPEL